MKMCKRGVLLSLFLTLALSIMLPFSISANQSLPAPFIGVNANVIGTDTYADHVTIESFNLTPSTLTSSLTGVLDCQTPSSPSSSSPCDVYSLKSSTSAASTSGLKFSWPVFSANGSNLPVSNRIRWTFEYEFIFDNSYVGSFDIQYTLDNTTYSKTIFVNGSSVNFSYSAYIPLSSFDYVTFTITDLSLSRNKLGHWDFPIESFNFITYFFGIKEPVSYYATNDYLYPMFSLSSNDQIWRSTVGSGSNHVLIFYIDKYITASNYNNYISYPSDFNVNFSNISLVPLNNTAYGRIVKFTFTNTSSLSQSLRVEYTGANANIMPIYSGSDTNKLLSIDFALKYGLSNELLDNLDLIANGTTGSNQAASNVTDESSNLTDVSDDIHNMESTFNSDLNNNLQAIDTTVTPGTFGSSFLTSASWVKTQFDQLTSNTPFGSVLSFSLVLGLGLLIVGRALK